MIKLFLFAASLAFAQGAGAQACLASDAALVDAQASVEKMQLNFNAGAATSFDVLMAQKRVYEIQLCKDPSDYKAYKALADNVAARLKFIQALADAGAATSEAVDLVVYEEAGMSKGCTALLKSVENQFAHGIKTSQDVAIVQSACSVLP